VHIQSVTDDIAESLGLKDHNGALVADVTPAGPAAKAGLKGGDVILKFDGKEVNEFSRLPRIVSETPINKEVEVDVLRDGKKLAVKVTVAELPDDKDLDQGAPEKPQGGKKGSEGGNVVGMGFSVAPVTAGLRDKFGLADGAKGLVITDIRPTSSAAEKGLRAGDLVIEVDHDDVKTLADINGRVEAARKVGHKSVFVLIESDGAHRYVTLKVDDNEEKEKDSKDKKSK